MSKPSSPTKKTRSCLDQCVSLSTKNCIIQKRRPSLTAAEYFVVVCCKYSTAVLYIILVLPSSSWSSHGFSLDSLSHGLPSFVIHMSFLCPLLLSDSVFFFLISTNICYPLYILLLLSTSPPHLHCAFIVCPSSSLFRYAVLLQATVRHLSRRSAYSRRNKWTGSKFNQGNTFLVCVFIHG